MITVNSREGFLIELNKLLPEDSNVCEIGSLYGDFAQLILDIINPSELILIDPYSKSETQYSNGLNTAYSNEEDFKNILKRFETEIENNQIQVWRFFSYDIVKFCPDNKFDFLYLDASHLINDVTRDLNDWLSKIKYGGILAGHDYIDIDGFGVIEAVNNFMHENNFEMFLFNENGGDWAIKINTNK